MPSHPSPRKLESSVNLSTQHGPTQHGPAAGPAADELIDAATACRLLGIKPASLYAYVSRGLVRSVRVGHARAHLYVGEDVRRIATRAAARRGHGAVAAGALRWGEPVLESAITSVEGGVLAYRGHRVVDLVARGVGFEQVAELLWDAPTAAWPTPADRGRLGTRPAPDTPVRRMIAALPAIAARDRRPWMIAASVEHERGRALIRALAVAAGARFASSRPDALGDSLAAAIVRGTDPALVAGKTGGPPVAGKAGASPGAWHAAEVATVAAIDAALVASADHELNASTFAARVAASAGADLYACVGAALYTFTGPRHGGAADAVDGFLDELPVRNLRAALASRLGRGERLPGFGHRLYPDGDPRMPVVAAALPRPRTARATRRLAQARAVMALGHELTGEHPSFDYALVMLVRALGLPPPWAAALFGLGRVAGWIAHVLEQRASGAMLRPRARYVGAPVG